MTKREIIETGRRVLEIEAGAVATLAPRLDDSFARAVDLLYRTKSRIIVIGMGKSGLVGRKIAATLASCGTPAMFIHPAEAGHGDLGMILANDVILAVSYSGETREIVDMLQFIKRIGVKLICLTGDRDSRIAQVQRHRPRRARRERGRAERARSDGELHRRPRPRRRPGRRPDEEEGIQREGLRLRPSQGRDGEEAPPRRDTSCISGGDIPVVRPETPMAEVIDDHDGKRLGHDLRPGRRSRA